MRAPARKKRQEGVALMLVLVFVALLSAIVVEYAYENQVEASLASANQSGFEAYIAAKSAVAHGLSLLETDLMGLDEYYGAGTQSASQSSTSGTGQEPEDYDSFFDIWVEQAPHEELNGATMHCYIMDEGGKLNVNALMANELETNPVVEEILYNLFEAYGVDELPVDAIADWLDPDDDPRPDGAETDYYSSLETPYTCRNGPMASIEELLLIRGITPELYFYCNAESSEVEARAEEEGELPLSLPDLLTAYVNPLDPAPHININTARPELLEAVYAVTEDGNVSAVDMILEAREEEPFVSLADLQSRGFSAASSGDSESGSLFDVRSDFFRIYGDGETEDVMVRVEAMVWRIPYDARMNEGYKILDWRVIR